MSSLPDLGLRFDEAQLTEARTFLAALAGENAILTFQTFPDRNRSEVPNKKGDPRNRIIVGRFDEVAQRLVQLNNNRAGVFVCVNQQTGRWRSDKTTVRARAIWHENDGAIRDDAAPVWPTPPSAVVQTSPNHSHFYWFLQAQAFAPAEWGVWEGIERRLVQDFGSDPNCLKRCQVLRVPGFWHVKNPLEPHLVRIKSCTQTRYGLADLAVGFPPVDVQRSIAPITEIERDTEGLADLPIVTETEWADVKAMLDYINPDAPAVPTNDGGDGTRSRWLRVLMALEETKHPERRLVAEEWSRCGGALDQQFPSKPDGVWGHFNEGEVDYQMSSFRRATGNKVGLGTLIRLAREGGWPGWKHSRQEDDSYMLPEGAKEQPDLFVVTSGDEALSRRIPPQDFLLHGFLSGAGTLSAIAGRGGVGKSKLTLGIAASVATGKPAFGLPRLVPPLVGGSVIVDLENDPDEFSRRWQDQCRAMVEHRQIAKGDLGDVMRAVKHVHVRKIMFPLTQLAMGNPVRHHANWTLLYDALSRVRDQMKDGVRWVCFDALYRLHAVSENESNQATVALNNIDELVNAVFGSIPRTIIHHSAKGAAGKSYFDADGGSGMRGSSAIEAAVRSVAQVRTLMDTEWRMWGIEESKRREFAICSVMKSNQFVMEPDWFLMRSFGSIWWHSERAEEHYRDLSQLEVLHSEKFLKFLALMYEHLEVKHLTLTIRKAHAYFGKKQGFKNLMEVEQYVILAEQNGYVVMDQRGFVKWIGKPMNTSAESFADIMGD